MSTGGGARPQRVFIGDVQGCADELDDLLGALDYHPSRHQLWCAGDLVNRGPASLRTLRRLVELGAQSVLGNHDLHLLGVAAGERRLRKNDTFEEVLAAPDCSELLGWLRARPLVQLWDDIALVHAGLHPHWDDPRAVAAPLEAEIRRGAIPWRDASLVFLTRVRHCDAEGARPQEEFPAPDGFAPWDAHYTGRRLVVCGHWAARGLHRTARVHSIDTGCIWGGRLTAWIAEEDRCVSVPARRVYCDPKAFTPAKPSGSPAGSRPDATPES